MMMKFHEIHGVNAIIDDKRLLAQRTSGSFCDAFVFSATPLRLNNSLVIRLSSSTNNNSSSEWHGCCFLGLTSQNPTSFIDSVYSKHIIHLLSLQYGCSNANPNSNPNDETQDVWFKQILEQWSNATLILSLNTDGQLEITSEYDPNIKYIFLDNLPINFPLWLVLDLYGKTDQCHFPRYSSPNSREIVSLGSDVYSIYKCGESGVVPYNTARIILIGPKSSGKTQLKNAFVNNLSQESQLEQDGTDNMYNYHLCTNNGGEWTLVNNPFPGQQNKVIVKGPDKSDLFHQLAKNIVHEIVLSVAQQENGNGMLLLGESAGSTNSTKDLIKNVLKFPKKLIPRPYSREVKQLSENLNEIPDELMLMIEELLKSIDPKTVLNNSGENSVSASNNDGDNQADEQSSIQQTNCDGGELMMLSNKQKYIINVSDFSGNILHLLINQFFFTSCAVYIFVFNLSDDLESTSLSQYENLACISELGNQPLSLLRSIHLWISLIHSTIAGYPIPEETLPITNYSDADNKPNQSTSTSSSFDIQPQVVLVGTHRNSIHAEPITRNQTIKEIFEKIQTSFTDTSYGGHLFHKYIALDSKEMSFDEPDMVKNLRMLIEQLVRHEKMTGFNVPLCWMQLEQILEKFKQRGIYFVDISQLHEVVSSQIDAFQMYENLNSALYFYHNQGKIFYLDCVNNQSVMVGTERQANYELGIIILDPNWFINCIYDLCSFLCSKRCDDDNLFLGIISETAINQAWAEIIDQKFILLGCLENLDLICELSPYLPMEESPDVATTNTVPKLYFFPWITKPVSSSSNADSNEDVLNSTDLIINGRDQNDPDGELDSESGVVDDRDSVCDNNNSNNNNNINNNSSDNGGRLSPGVNVPGTASFGESTFQFVITFDILPVSFFTRLLIRLSRWSWNQGWGRKPEMFNSKGRIAVDFDHDIILKINLLDGRIYLIILKIFEEIPSEQLESLVVGPAANVCVKVQNLIENELALLKNSYYRRLSYRLVIPCPCDAVCDRHKIEGCIDESCLHFLNLHECLQKKVVECRFHRQVRTNFIQRYLPYAPAITNDMYESIMTPPPNGTSNLWENVFQVEQLWMREAAKLLNVSQHHGGGGHHGNHASSSDWISLAKRLSYTERDVMKFSAELSPSLALLKDWYESNGRTRYCVDVLVSCLRMLSREDIASLIEYEIEPESVSPPIFLSYQHDSQKQVLEIRRKLELSGFPCWMDTKSINGGDSLYGKIYEGISRAKVFICCLTPRYVASPMCNREVALADVLHKPILPLIIEFTPWPPPGAMALIMSSIVYVDLCGVGSHSGTGRTQDTESRFREILDHISRYITGYSESPFVQSRYLQLPDLFNTSNVSTHHQSGPNRRHHGLGGGGHHGRSHNHHHGGDHGNNLLIGNHHLGHHVTNFHNRMSSTNSSLMILHSRQHSGEHSSADSMASSNRRHHHNHQHRHSPSAMMRMMERDIQQIIRGANATTANGIAALAAIGSSGSSNIADNLTGNGNGGLMMDREGDIDGDEERQQRISQSGTSSSRLISNSDPGNEDQMARPSSDGDMPFTDEIIADDNISVITRARIANRITNCSVCVIS